MVVSSGKVDSVTSNMRFSTVLFFKIYLIIMVSIMTVSTVLDKYLENIQAQPTGELASLSLFEHFSIKAEAHAELLPDNIRLLERDAIKIPPSLEEELNRKGIILLGNSKGEEQYLVRTDDKNKFISLGSGLKYDAPPVNTMVITFIFYAFISLILSILLLPLTRDIALIRHHVMTSRQGLVTKIGVTYRFSWLKDFAKAYDAMVDRITELLNTQKELMYGVSHELRTPLARLKFSTALLNSEVSEVAQAKNLMQRDIRDLEGLVNELLDYARFENGGYPVNNTRVEVLPWLQEVIDGLSTSLGDFHIHLHPSDGAEPSVIFDPVLTQRAVENLILNAKKYANTKACVRVEWDASWCTIVVDDDGEGIAEADRALVFDAFKRLATTDTQSGWGLGLALTKRIMKSQQGDVSVSSSPLGGARFILQLPCDTDISSKG